MENKKSYQADLFTNRLKKKYKELVVLKFGNKPSFTIKKNKINNEKTLNIIKEVLEYMVD